MKRRRRTSAARVLARVALLLFLSAPATADVFAIYFAAYEDGSERTVTIYYHDGAPLCATTYTFYCPALPCMAVDAPMNELPLCWRHFLSRDGSLTGAGLTPFRSALTPAEGD
jgi:hypothetical protein